MSDKGDIKLMSVVALLMLVVSIVTLIGIAIVDGIGDDLKDPTAVVNEAITATNATYVALANDEISASPALVAFNGSVTVPATSYVLDRAAGEVYDLESGIYDTDWNMTYTYGHDTDASTTAALFVLGLIVFATFASLITLVLVGKIIIGLISKDKTDEGL